MLMSDLVMEKKWIYQEVDESELLELQNELPIHPVFLRLLIQRGVKNYDEAKKFFRPSLDHLHDPFLMKDMDKAVARLLRALENDEKVLIYGDYDVDGTTSVALVYSFLKRYFNNINFYIPDRYKEGYGISKQGIDFAKENGFTLIIALDCGIRAVDKIEYANTLGIDFIIGDHHLPGQELPKAVAVLDPKRSDCEYPYKELSGCGIGFKLLQAFALKKKISFKKLAEYLDIVAISIASDIVPITGENRVMAYHGLKLLNNKPRKGLDVLFELNGIKTIDEETGEIKYKEIDINAIVFMIGPRINASGRMGDACDAVRMLIAEDETTARKYAELLNTKNEERVGIDKDITEDALDMIRNSLDMQKRKSTVLFNPEWHKGVIGIVASRVIETFYKPTILLTESGGLATGSARSVSGYNVYEAINACGDLLEKYGGHKYAAGLSLKVENIPQFIERFESYVASTISREHLVPAVRVDAEIDFKVINRKFFNILKQFEPFGPGNMRPVFVSRNVRDSGYSKVVGDNHLKVALRQNGSSTIKGIAFNKGKLLEPLSTCKTFDICYALKENHWNGNTYLEMDARDFRFPI